MIAWIRFLSGCAIGRYAPTGRADPAGNDFSFVILQALLTAPQWVHEVYGFFLAVPAFAIVFGAFAANVYLVRCAPFQKILEAAEAYGMTPRQTFWRIIVPQIGLCPTGLSNLWMVLIKATPLLFLLVSKTSSIGPRIRRNGIGQVLGLSASGLAALVLPRAVGVLSCLHARL